MRNFTSTGYKLVRAITIAAAMLTAGKMQAQYIAPSVYSSVPVTLDAVSIGDTLSFSDPDFGKSSWADIDTHLYVNHSLDMRINYDGSYTLSDSITVRVMTHTFYLDADSVSHDFRDTLQARYNPHDPSEPQNIMASTNRQGYHHADVVIEDIEVVTTLGSWSLQAVSLIQIYQISLIELIQSIMCTTPVYAYHSIASLADVPYSGTTLHWSSVAAAHHYELEWAFVDMYSYEYSVLNNTSTTSYDFPSLFKNRATRIITSQNNYKLFPIYEEGLLFYRVRAVFINGQGLASYSQWSTEHSQNSTGGASALAKFDNDFELYGHQPEMNWNYTAVFAEEGKTARSIEYFDGALRPRQSQSFLNTEKESVIGEGVYDEMGRRAMEIIPTPSNRDYLGFDPLYNRLDGGLVMPMDIIPANCTDPSYGLDQLYGSAAYYSENNPDIALENNNFIPHANGFVYTMNSFMPDNTGRVRESASVGEAFAMGGDHTTKYMYSSPTPEELFPFFGNEAGNPNAYKKNYVMDPNGQMSFSILNDKDQVVVTGLTGAAPEQLQELDSANPPTIINLSLLGNNRKVGSSLVSTYDLVVTERDDITINYSVDPEQFHMDCMPEGVCYDCAYDLKIRISDMCGNAFNEGVPFDTTISNFTLGSLNLECANSFDPQIVCTRIFRDMDKGQYLVEKTLSLNQGAVQEYLDHVVTIASCLADPEDFLDAAQAQQLFSACDLTCESCLLGVGDQEDFIDNYVSNLEGSGTELSTAELEAQALEVYNGLIASCQELCDAEYQSPCEDLREKMLADLTPPFGQYAKAQLVDGNYIATTIETIESIPYYIFNILNVSFEDALTYSDVSINYLDENGDPEPQIEDFEGVLRNVNQLNVNDFVVNFKESWAESLLPLHPEYKYYEWCHNNIDLTSGVIEYDKEMELIESYQEALDGGFLNPLASATECPTALVVSPTNYDPIAGVSFGSLNFGDQLADRLDNYILNYSVWEIAASAFCADASSCVFSTGGYTSNCEGDKNKAWLLFKTLYQRERNKLIFEFAHQYAKANDASHILIGGKHYDLRREPEILAFGGSPPWIESWTDMSSSDFHAFVINNSGCTCYYPSSSANNTSYVNYNFLYTQQRRVVSDDYATYLMEFLPDNLPDSQPEVDALMEAETQDFCESYRSMWLNDLQSCFTDLETPETTIDEILDLFTEICSASSDATHMMGATDSPTPVTHGGIDFYSFEDVLEHYLGSGYENIDCKAYNITAPGSYAAQPSYGNFQTSYPQNCICSQLSAVQAQYALQDPPDATLSEFIQNVYGQYQPQSELNQLIAACNDESGTCSNLPTDFSVVPILDCGQCMDCGRMAQLYLEFRALNPEQTDIAAVQDNFVSYVNYHTGFSFNYGEYIDFMLECSGQDSSFVIDMLSDGPLVDMADEGSTLPLDTVLSVQCEELADAITDHNNNVFAPGATGYTTSLVAYLNSEFGLNGNFSDYWEFIQHCGLYDQTHWDDDPSLADSLFTCEDLVDLVESYNICHPQVGTIEYCKYLTMYLNNVLDTTMYFQDYYSVLSTCLNQNELDYLLANADSCIKPPRMLDCEEVAYYFGEIILNNPSLVGDYKIFIRLEKDLDAIYDQYNQYSLCDYLNMLIHCKNDPYNDSLYFLGEMGGIWPNCDTEIDCYQLYNSINNFNSSVYVGTAPNSNPGYIDSVTVYLNEEFSRMLTFCDYWNVAAECWDEDYAEDLLGPEGDCEGSITCNELESAIQAFNSNYGGTIGSTQYTTDLADHLNDIFDMSRDFCFYFKLFAQCTSIPNAVNNMGDWISCLDVSCGDLIHTVADIYLNIPKRNYFPTDEAYMEAWADSLNDQLELDYTYCEYYEWMIGCIGFQTTNNFLVVPCEIDMCYNCDTITGAIKDFVLTVDPSTDYFPILLSDYLNSITGWSLTYQQYANFVNDCIGETELYAEVFGFTYNDIITATPTNDDNPLSGGNGNNYLWSDNPLGIDYDDYEVFQVLGANSEALLCNNIAEINESEPLSDCEQILYDIAYTAAQQAYETAVSTLRERFLQEYTDHCLGQLEQFDTDAPSMDYHFTLYYYDQAGNLVKTVPPEGVVLLNPTQLGNAINHFNHPTSYSPVYNNQHYLTTRYWYNSQNQVIKQFTPDGDTTRFWYDYLGRLILSQSARQEARTYFDASEEDSLHYYTYTKYDDLNRITEVGELEHFVSPTYLDANATTETFLTYINGGSYYRSEITRTFYDFSPIEDIQESFGDNGAENLRSRVAMTAVYKDMYKATDEYEYATHYSYDIAGNVKTLIQENKKLEYIGHSIKRIDYDYDQISGKVNYCWFQRDSMDQFIHKYNYDRDNRLTEVETSTDGIHFNRDAIYSYYKHGPLSREVIGDGVQGLDFYYTLQGWIKGVNSPMLYGSTDPSHDGTTLSYAKDVFGYALGYYSGDYTAIGELSSTPIASPLPGDGTGVFEDPTTATTALNSGKSLYNGNIRHMMQALDHLALHGDTTLGFTYEYDQLNRLVGMDAWSDVNYVNQRWAATEAWPDYKERVAYDAMGNIKKYLRNGTTMGSNSLDMDSLTYKFEDGVNNQLKWVDENDGISSSNYSVDIDEQSAGNYLYDRSGNLTDDVSEGLEIYWNLQGKVDSIYKSGDNTKIKYLYDASGNRIGKRIHETGGRTYTWYVRDASGNILSIFNEYPDDDKMYHSEYDIYGSARLGTINRQLLVFPRPEDETPEELSIGLKSYELSNHLGNVLSTVSDLKLAVDSDSDDVTDSYEAIVINQQSYYPFGMLMPEMQYSLNNNETGRHGFQGQEKENEISVEGSFYNYKFRMHDARLGRFLSTDPLSNNYPHNSPYAFSENRVIDGLELEGLEFIHYSVWNVNEDGSVALQVVVEDEVAQKSYGNWVLNITGGFGGLIDEIMPDVAVVWYQGENDPFPMGYYVPVNELVSIDVADLNYHSTKYVTTFTADWLETVSSSFAGVIAGSTINNKTPKSDWKGPADYSRLPEPKNIKPGGTFNKNQLKAAKELNRNHNNGALRSDIDGTFMDPSVQSKRGVKANMNQVEGDHKVPRNPKKGEPQGTNSNSNLQLITKKQNIDKSNK